MKRTAMIFCALLATAAAMAATETADSAYVSLETNQGAEIGIDGKMSSTNFMTAKVPVGTHTVTVLVGTQYQKDFTCEVLPGDDNKYSFILDGTLDITARPANAYIYVDGQRVGRGHATIDNIVGLHNVKVDTDNEKYDYQLLTVNIRPDSRESRSVELRKLPPRLRFFGELTWSPNDFGVMLGMCSRFGGYVRLATDLKTWPWNHDFEKVYDIYQQRTHYVKQDDHTSYITGGAMMCLHDNIYAYLGAGYGAHYAEYNGLDLGANGVMVDGGLILRLDWLSLSAGYSRMVTYDGIEQAKFGELVIGLGINFKL